MTSTLTTYQYVKLKLSFPSLNTSTMVRVSSRLKTPNVIELMEMNDSHLYEIQQNEIKQIINQIRDCIKCNKDTSELISLKCTTQRNHIKFTSYCLLPNRFYWLKLNSF